MARNWGWPINCGARVRTFVRGTVYRQETGSYVTGGWYSTPFAKK
ncbi:hypothetical protein [Nocardioides daejeonensis]|nr:hypothetical protein [Nocardioides daejeonensis]